MSLFWSSSEGGVSGIFFVLCGVIAFSVEEEGVSGRKFRIESSESESMTVMSDDKLNYLLGSVFIFDVSMGVICVSEMCEMSLRWLGGLEATSILVVLLSIGVLSTVPKYT